MKTYYMVEANGNILTMTCENEPWFFAFGNVNWFKSREEAIERRHSELACNVKTARDSMSESTKRLRAFEAAIGWKGDGT